MKGIIIMNKKEKLLLEIRQLCRESEEDLLDTLCAKALFLYTSVKNLKELKKFAVEDLKREKEREESS